MPRPYPALSLPLALLALGALVGPARAQSVITTGGAVTVVSPPADLHIGAFQSDTLIRAFREQQNLVLAAPLAVDVVNPGLYDTLGSLPAVQPDLAAGTRVNSLMLHSDPVSPRATYDGTVTFDADVLGVILISRTLSDSDATLGLAGVSYPFGDNRRGLELGATGRDDSAALSADRRTVTLHFQTSGNVDEVRVLTAAVPEPGLTSLLAGAGLSASLCLRRRARKSA